MYVKKMAGFVLSREEECIFKGKLDTFQPPTIQCTRWKHWVAQLDFKTCFTCRNHHGKIYSVNEIPDMEPPVHPNCRCEVQNMEAVFAGEATKDSENGADWWIKNMKKQGGFIAMIMDIYHRPPAVYGGKQISITTAESAMGTVCFGQMTVWSL